MTSVFARFNPGQIVLWDACAEVAVVRERAHAPRILRQGGRDAERPQPHLHQHGRKDVQLEPRHARAASGDAAARWSCSTS